MNKIPKTKLVSRCEACLHWEYQHWITESGGIACTTCGSCYRPEENAVFLTRLQYVKKYPGSVLALDVKDNPHRW